MTNILNHFERLTLDQKRYLGLAVLCLFLLVIYAFSRVSDAPSIVIEDSKPEDFKSGNLVTDDTPEFYRRKDELTRKQNEAILSAQKSLEEKVTELGKRMEDGKTGSISTTAVSAVAENGQSPPPDLTEGDSGKKLIRRGQNQSKMNFPSATQVAA